MKREKKREQEEEEVRREERRTKKSCRAISKYVGILKSQRPQMAETLERWTKGLARWMDSLPRDWKSNVQECFSGNRCREQKLSPHRQTKPFSPVFLLQKAHLESDFLGVFFGDALDDVRVVDEAAAAEFSFSSSSNIMDDDNDVADVDPGNSDKDEEEEEED